MRHINKKGVQDMKTRTLEESMKFTAQFADETLKRAEDAGLTLAEVLNLPNMIKNKTQNGIRQQGTLYKQETPRNN